MKSVGEVMAIGRTFKESLQKAIRSLEIGHAGLESPELPEGEAGEKALWDADRRAAAGPALGDRRGVPPRRPASRRCTAALGDRSVVPAATCARSSRRRPTLDAASATERDRMAAAGEAGGLLGSPPRGALGHRGGRGARAAPRERRAPGLQARRHLRRGVRGVHAVPLLDLRGGVRGRAHEPRARS